MIKNNAPLRWIDVNRVDAATLERLLQRTDVTFNPVNGDGSKAFGDVSFTYPTPEELFFWRPGVTA